VAAQLAPCPLESAQTAYFGPHASWRKSLSINASMKQISVPQFKANGRFPFIDLEHIEALKDWVFQRPKLLQYPNLRFQNKIE
jgi:hypothetical protein